MKNGYTLSVNGTTLIHDTAIIEGDDVYIGNHVTIGPGVRIKSKSIKIGDYTKLESHVNVNTPDKFVVGECGWFANNIKITARSFEIGDYAVVLDRVEVGRGGCTGPNSHVKIGNFVMICEGTVLNPSESITIGDDVGIGAECEIWTHGGYLDVLSGYPASFDSVTIGNHVWLPSRSIVLPGITIGSDVVIGINTLVNKDVPSGSFAAGMPIKIIKENAYPRQISADEQTRIVQSILRKWYSEMVPYKRMINVATVTYNPYDSTITLFRKMGGKTVYHLDNVDRKIVGEIDLLAEDLRDYLRRHGIKIFTGKPFQSIPSPDFK